MTPTTIHDLLVALARSEPAGATIEQLAIKLEREAVDFIALWHRIAVADLVRHAGRVDNDHAYRLAPRGWTALGDGGGT